jgi:aldehyde dehydrogenase
MSNIISRPEFKAKYDNYREVVAPINGEYFDVICPLMEKYLRRRLILAKRM